MSFPGQPSPAHELLLDACLAEGDAASAAWRGWRATVDLDRVDRSAQRLLPLLYHNLSRHGVAGTDADVGRYRGVHRLAWYENRTASARAAAVVAAFAAAGIPTLVLKGAAFAHLHYPAGGVRPMGDADVLVPAASAPAAIRLLLERGLRPHPDRTEAHLLAYDLPKRHGWEFRDADGRGIDLHWRLLAVSAEAALDAPFWSGARPLRIHNVDTLTLSDAHHLVHVCVHALCPGPVDSCHWVADAAMILRRAAPGAFDWAEVLTTARRHRLEAFLAPVLRYLADRFALPVPPGLVAALAAEPLAPWQRAEVAAFAIRDSRTRRRYHCWHRLGRLRATSPAWAARPRPLAYLEMMRLQWEVPALRALPLAAARKLARRLRRA